MALRDLTGQKFGRLTVLHRDTTKPKGHGKPVYWVCQCECGNIKSIYAHNLTMGKTQSCGCLRKEQLSKLRFDDISGKQFGFLIPLHITGDKDQYGGYIWHCRCTNCGGFKDVPAILLKQGRTKSCGCIGQSFGEAKIKEILTQNNISYKEQYTFKDLISPNGGILRFDFGIFKENKLWCVIEYQGIQHYQKSPQFDNWESLEERQFRDEYKRNYCKQNNIKLIEIPYLDENKLDWNYLKEKCDL